MSRKYTGASQMIGGRETKLNFLGQRVYTDSGFLAPAAAGSTIETVSQTAMEKTQRRAAEDRKLALAGVTGRETPALEAIRQGRRQGLESFAGTEELLAQARGEVSPENEAMMYEQQRTGIEAGTQAGLRGIQERYARGGAPGSAAMRMMGDVRSAGAGQLSEAQRQIQLDRYNKLMGLTGQAGQIAGQKAGIYGQEGRNLADIYGTTGRSLADIYSNTITAVPDYSQVAGLGGGGGGGGGGTTITTSSFRSAPKTTTSRGGGIGGGMTASQRFSQRARESTGASIRRHRADMARSGGFPRYSSRILRSRGGR